MAVQEPGELTSINYSTPFSVDSNTLFELKQAQLSAVTKHNKDKRYSLVFLVRNSLIPFIKNNTSSVEGYQSIELTKPYNLTIINTYFQHNQTIRKITFGKVQSSIKKLRNNFIILGDFNSIIDRQLDHYSSHNSCPPTKKFCIADLINEYTIDSFRTLNPNSKEFTRWNTINKKDGTSISATRLDYILISKNLQNKLLKSFIVKKDTLNSDHLPIITSIDMIALHHNHKRTPIIHWPNHKRWPERIFINIEANLSYLPNSLESINDIELYSETLTNGIINELNEYRKSLESKHSKHTYEIPEEMRKHKKLSNLLISISNKLQTSITMNKPLPTQLINKAKIKTAKTNFNYPTLNPDSPIQFLNEIKALTKKLRNEITFQKKIYQSKEFNQMITNKIKEGEFDSKTIYKLIQSPKTSNDISFLLDEQNNHKIITDEETIKQRIFQHFQTQFQKETVPKNLDEFLRHVPKITKSFKPNFSKENIEQLLTSKQNTSPGEDKIPYQFFKYMKTKTSKLFDKLHTLYTACYTMNYIPKRWKLGLTSLIPKPKSHESLENWRPITLLNTLYKGFTLLLNISLQKTLIESNVIPEEQCGFLPNKSTNTAITTYLEIIKHTAKLRIPLQAIYIDFKLAFDSVQHWVLSAIMKHIELDPNLRNILETVMTNSSTKFKTAFGYTEKVDLKIGVKQGDPLSPILYLLYMLPLQLRLKSTLHIYHPNIPINHLCYADDLLLIASLPDHIKELYNVTTKYAKLTDMKIKSSKSAYTTIFTPPIFSPSFEGIPIPYLKSNETYNYLGMEISLNLAWSKHLKDIEKTYKHAVNIICSKNYLETKYKIKLINTVAHPLINYSLQFIQPPPAYINSLDNYTTTALNKSIHMINQSKETYWSSIRNLTLFKNSSPVIYVESKINRGLNSTSSFLTQSLITNLDTTTTESLVPPLPETLSKLNLSLKFNDTPEQSPPQTQIIQSHINMFTDASLHFKNRTGSCAIYVQHLLSKSFPPSGTPNSTNFELQAILHGLKEVTNYSNITIYTDSKPSIDIIHKFTQLPKSQQLKLSYFHVISEINSIISTRKSKEFTTAITHVNSHLLNKKQYSTKDRHKLMNLKEKYGRNLFTILKGNDEADKLTKIQFPIQPLEKTNSFYPKIYVTHHSSPVIGSLPHYIKPIQKLKDNLKWKESKRSLPSLNESVHPISFLELFPKFHDHLQHLSQSLFLTKQRAFNYYLTPKPSLHPLKLLNAQNLFSTPYCNICNPLQIESHLHLNTCQITLEIHDKLLNHLQSINKNLSPWFTTSQHKEVAPYDNFTQQLGNLGYIPLKLTSLLQNNNLKTLHTIAYFTQMYMTAKWSMIKMSHYHPLYNLEELVKRSKILNNLYRTQQNPNNLSN
jgi:exonuclease III/ribonuclease HI